MYVCIYVCMYVCSAHNRGEGSELEEQRWDLRPDSVCELLRTEAKHHHRASGTVCLIHTYIHTYSIRLIVLLLR